MKFVVYLLMWLLLEPILQVGGVTVGGLFLIAMLGLGVYLLVRRKDRPANGPQDSYYYTEDPGPAAPTVVYVVAPTPCPFHDDEDTGPAALHPARHPQRDQFGALRWGLDR